ncbi:hypothetical protein LEP1GSC049_1625 [Leptospira kirschneri serovar Cynopteri str. 3522 CT]|uniref:Uncharacterized protein n=1 Tax=Leptospira kirschneri str. 200802841 TaxID=1193047 RepID=A0A828XWB6_9LEPT|nr:hypothetical protein LEP1GSC044_0097 [Leptospira kirschneri serovar Grippotyphosa str. RM52]EKO51740.1 hypothetical protein LEP1GSC131_1451 [Leptospira kirschneri str. 200802841]EKQ83371.1 hypothetical protein LEP1GSC064_1099 [Leptospira kirschneri serovar Grippotyphosa str. Moskva]EKR08225.1 hypothetical protein LEP1GSC122_2318 [Leptospira kirschneri serovar Valbuzzi str. 200702274]EMK05035.1 hypothetical protein LEP1GSC176_1962 [Leptospira kirschneri str. MMD1493]EMK13917.1 hypothetical p
MPGPFYNLFLIKIPKLIQKHRTSLKLRFTVKIVSFLTYFVSLAKRNLPKQVLDFFEV